MQAMMSSPQSTISNSTTYSEYLHIILTISQIDLHLLQATCHVKASRATYKHFFSAMCQTC